MADQAIKRQLQHEFSGPHWPAQRTFGRF